MPVLEGIAALSLASNIIQLLEFSIKIGELTQSFRKNCGNLPKDLQRVEDLVNDLVPIAERLQHASAKSSSVLLQEQSLVSLLSGCVSEAADFKNLLDSLKSTGQTGWGSFILALKATRRAGKIKSIERALESYKSAMTLRITEASLAKQEYTCELLNQNQQARSQEAQTTLDALYRLDSSINTSFRHMEGKIHQLSQQSESTAEAGEQARREIEKIHADHAAWAREHNALQKRLRSTHLSSRPIILQFQSMHRRKPRNTPRKTSTAVLNYQDVPNLNEVGSDHEQAAEKRKACSYINIVISLSVNATPQDLMHSLKQLLYTSWSEVTRRIIAAVPDVYYLSDKEQTVDEPSSTIDEDETSRTILLGFLENHAEDELLIYDHASSTLRARNDYHGLNRNVTCCCDFYWKGLSQKLLEVNAEPPSTVPTLQYRPVYYKDAASAQPLEYSLEVIPKVEPQIPVTRQSSHSRQPSSHNDRQERRRRKRSRKARKVFMQSICIIPAFLILLSLFFSAYSFMLQDYAVWHASTYAAFWHLRDYWLGTPETKDSTYDGSRQGLKDFDEQWAKIKRNRMQPKKHRKPKVVVL